MEAVIDASTRRCNDCRPRPSPSRGVPRGVVVRRKRRQMVGRREEEGPRECREEKLNDTKPWRADWVRVLWRLLHRTLACIIVRTSKGGGGGGVAAVFFLGTIVLFFFLLFRRLLYRRHPPFLPQCLPFFSRISNFRRCRNCNNVWLARWEQRLVLLLLLLFRFPVEKKSRTRY